MITVYFPFFFESSFDIDRFNPPLFNWLTRLQSSPLLDVFNPHLYSI